MLTFEWNERKNRRNRAKHGIWFEEARTVFDDPHALLLDDSLHSEQESRFLLLGFSAFAKLLVVVHCYREENDTIRIISARKATNTEVQTYEERI